MGSKKNTLINKLQDLPDEVIERIPMDMIEQVEPSAMNGCVPGRACQEEDYFEMITVCAICGKLF